MGRDHPDCEESSDGDGGNEDDDLHVDPAALQSRDSDDGFADIVCVENIL
jgi:hypothetical protein